MLYCIRIIAITLIACLALPDIASAQSRFSPVVKVGESIISRYQLDQRTLFLSLLGAGGNPRENAREQLINEAIQLSTAAAAGYAPTDPAIEGGQAEFAARAQLSREDFLAALAQNGVDPSTFRDFIRAGVAWREYLRGEFGETIRASIPDAQIDRTFAQTGTEGGTRYLFSEIILPFTSPETAAASRARAAELAALSDVTDFSAAARRFSIARTRSTGGEREWLAQEAMPPEFVPVISGLAIGQTSRPLEIDGIGIFIFHLRDLEVVGAGTPETLDVDYALFLTGPDTASPGNIIQDIDHCDDLYAVARSLPEDRLIREIRPLGELPSDIRTELASLDINEASTTLTRSGRPALLMLCNRTAAVESTVDRSIIGTRLLNIRLGSVASNRLAEIRARTTIIDLGE